MKKTLTLLTVLFGVTTTFFLIFVPTAQAATYYVAKTGSDSNPGTEALPFLTMGEAFDNMLGGDTVYVKEGTYDERISNTNEPPPGTSWDNATTVAAYPGHTPIIQPTYPGSGTLRVLDFNGAQGAVDAYIIFDGFVIDGVNLNSNTIKITNSANHIRITNSTVKNGTNTGILVSNEAPYVEIINNRIFNNGNGSGQHGVYLSTQNGTVRGNTIYDNTDDGVKVNDESGQGDNNLVEDNIVYDNLHGIEVTNGRYTIVRNNLVFSNTNYGLRGRSVNPTPGNIFINNTSVGNTYGIGIEAGFDDDPLIANNLLYGNTYGIYIDNTINGGTFSNNLSSGNTTDLSDSGTVTYVNNLIGSSYTAGLVDPEGYDFTLTQESDAIDNGVTNSNVTDDINGVPRPRGNAYDIGAYERYGNDADVSASGTSISTTNWIDSSNYNYLASSYSSVDLGSSLTLSKTNRLSNSGFTINEDGWTKKIGLFGFDPTSLGNLEAWYKADSITGVSNGGRAATWEDSTSNNHDAAQSTEAQKPVYLTDQINGYPALRGDKTDGRHFTISSNISITNDFNLYHVTKEVWPGSGLSSERPAILGHTSGTNQFGFHEAGRIWNRANSTQIVPVLSSNIDGTTYDIWSRNYDYDTTTATFFKNGTDPLDPTGGVSWNTGGAFTLSTLLAGNTTQTYFTGDMAELLIFSKELSSTERSQMDAYLNNKYFLPITSSYSSSTRNLDNYYNDVSSYNVVATTYDTDYLSTFTLSAAKKLNLKAYVYNGGSAVTSSEASLYFDDDDSNATISTTYTSLGSGWYELTGTVDATAGDYKMGVRVETGKNVYISKVFAEDYATSGTFTSSIFDSGTTSQFTTLTYDATTPTNTTVAVKVRGGINADLSDAPNFSSCTAITSGGEISTGSCVDLGDRYMQYQVTLSTTDTSVTPSLDSITINFTSYSTTTNISLTAPDNYTNNGNPTFVIRKPSYTANFSAFTITVDPDKNNSYTTGSIPVSGNGSKNYTGIDNDNIKVVYVNEDDTDTTNNEVHVTFKKLASSPLVEGKHTWKVTTHLTSGQGVDAIRDLFIDKTSPTLTSLDTKAYSQNTWLGSRNILKINGRINDLYRGSVITNSNSTVDTYDKIASGPHSVSIIVKQQSAKTGLTTVAEKEYIVNSFQDDGLQKYASFSFYFELPSTESTIYLIAKDKVGNTYEHPPFKTSGRRFAGSLTTTKEPEIRPTPSKPAPPEEETGPPAERKLLPIIKNFFTNTNTWLLAGIILALALIPSIIAIESLDSKDNLFSKNV